MAQNDIYKMTWKEVWDRFHIVVGDDSRCRTEMLWGVPRGGSVIAAMSGRTAESPAEAEVIVDDLEDSGRTKRYWTALYPDKPFVTLFHKKEPRFGGRWIQFPWEPEAEVDIAETVTRQLEYIGEDASREGLRETPARVIRAWGEMYSGYRIAPSSLFKTFQEGACREMVVLREVDFYSTCEHHMLPFFGTISIGYIPQDRVIGVSKLARLVDVFSRRLQIQERMTTQINEAIERHLEPAGTMVVCRARHLCMMARGVKKHAPEMVTSAIRGEFYKPEVRAEFLGLLRGGGLS